MIPLVSCVCPTFNRAPDQIWLLEEAVESFLRQDYPEKELIVVNDTPGQELVCDAVGVRVLNVLERFATLGEKRNWGCEQARGSLIAPWDDDDISLPHRISQGVEEIDDFGYWKPPQVWFLNGGGGLIWNHSVGYRHHASIFSKKRWREVGGYPATSGDEDARMDERLQGMRLPAFPSGIPRFEWAYIYRWGVSRRHLSGIADCNSHYRAIGQEELTPGRFELRPRWKTDYVSLAALLR